MSAAKIAHRTLRQDVNRDYTHLQVPFTALRESFADRRFLVAALALNFVIVPPVAFGLSQLAPAGRAVELGVLMVLLTPCIDYVIVFTRLAGGSDRKLLAAAPLLMLAPTQASAFAIACTESGHLARATPAASLRERRCSARSHMGALARSRLAPAPDVRQEIAVWHAALDAAGGAWR